MTPVRIFISSVQQEFSLERERLRDYLRGDPLMRRFFEVFLFEEVPASDRRPGRVYVDEVDRCDIYVGLFGRDYGSEDAEGVSPTEREFERATESEKHRLIFVKGAAGSGRHPKMEALIARAQAGLVRRRFATPAELIAGVYVSLVQYLEARELLRFGPFDAAPCFGATLDDLDVEDMYRFIRVARRARQFPLPAETPPVDLLRHLNLLNKGRLTNAAMLLFGQAPQRFLISSEIKCAHFHGTEVAKPIPSYQVYKGTVFSLVDQAVDFVLSKVALSVGTRAESVQAPVEYEIPKEVVTEAIVNAVAHRDYTDNSSVQVMLFADRLEVMNSGPVAAAPDRGQAAPAAPVAPGQSVAGGVDVPAAVHREDGDRDRRHDPTLRGDGPAGAGVRGRRGVPDQDLAVRRPRDHPRPSRHYPGRNQKPPENHQKTTSTEGGQPEPGEPNPHIPAGASVRQPPRHCWST